MTRTPKQSAAAEAPQASSESASSGEAARARARASANVGDYRQGPDSCRKPLSRVLVVDDEEPMRHMLRLTLEREGYDVECAETGEAALDLLSREGFDVIVTDLAMPGMGGMALTDAVRTAHPELTIVVMSAFGSVETALQAMNHGAYDYISKPFKQDEVVLCLRKAEERETLRRENRRLKAQLRSHSGDSDRLGDMLVHGEGMRKIARIVRKVAPFDSTTLLLGESGVGKELIARAVHDLSGRNHAEFVAVNCGAIPDNLLESELFGHVKGAFTDARNDRQGLFEAARGGTLFLDEIGELGTALQVKLLRVLQERELRRVGDNKSISVDVRVIAATSRALEQMVDERSFRSDLYYRLSVLPIHVPPLRERREDIAPLVSHFLERISARLGIELEGITAEALQRFVAYDWPGNVRELENSLEHAAVLSDDSWVDVDDLPERIRNTPACAEFSLSIDFGVDDLSVKRAQRSLERELILRALERTEGNRTHAAKLLDLSHRALLYKIKSFGLS